MGKRKVKKKKRVNPKGKIIVKRKFYNALQSLRRMSPKQQRLRAKNASKEFVTDVSNVMSKIRRRPNLVSNKHKKILRRYKKPLRQLVKKDSSAKRKRKVLLLRGGILPFLVPIICAGIGAAGSIGASAVGSAVMRA